MVSDRSNGIYRGVIVALVGLILAGASPPTKQEKQAATADKQEPAKAAAAISDEYKPQPDMYAESCYKADNHDSADFCAQWRSAIAAEKAADATIWGNSISTAGALLSFVSIVLVLIALGQTRKANRLTMKANARATRQAVASATETAKALEIAQINAESAIKQVEISELSAKRQLRPYVHIEKILPKRPKAGFNSVVLYLKNFGKTPAINLKTSFGAGIYTIGASLWPLPSVRVTLGRDIAPGHFQKAIIGFDYTEDEVRQLIDGLIEIHITYIVEYGGFGIDGVDDLTANIVYTSEGARVDVYEKEGNLT
jgi:hypothetical protein